jgi:AraC-like DNA-binding protein
VTDLLSDVLRVVRLTGAVFFAIDGSAPWVAETPPSRTIAPHIMPGVEHVIEYHAVTSGSCWGGVLGEPPVRLEAGDVIVFPQGDAHVVSSAPGMRGGPSIESVTSQHHPLRLPGSVETGSLLRQLIGLALVESAAQRPGGEAVLSRLSELLFVEIVRRHVATLPPQSVGWLAGLRDESIGRALQKLHERPAHPWSLEELAKQVGVSRSILADRFAHFVGVPPMQYLAQWRIQLAASLLRSSKSSLAEIASRVGYGSEAALSRAFKRWVGVAPAPYRRGEAMIGSAPLA